ncbi:4Fe-4S ferredoxin iron-sulfur binding domain protein [Desulfitobacterium hafniense DCB-2]|uniref:4Fe-4S ferredoxin iron-sulfur binding domain protein n=2 Tax=Desulfitobacterium hafniense TaxID=49338 RepID=B8FVV4_DESHD|nr:4Fe-4S dicluster domain-containing protein [Desulfitobacterium hafniense]ACL18740.1 4Fe-4S ferredoxin iron-sulfur binding domain protein [Desulfitobacterium hafniense DCB-2]
MIRKIIKIDEQSCDGCGLCLTACHEGALVLVNGKASLLRDDYCDGLGNCLPACPQDAISFEEREAVEFDEEAVKKHLESHHQHDDNEHHEHQGHTLACGCPGNHAELLSRPESTYKPETQQENKSQLKQWPVQIKLVPPNAPYFDNAHLLIAADCTAYAYGNFHNEFMRNRVTLIGCPKLDSVDYSEKLTAILQQNSLKSLTLVRMEVPCCGGLESAVKTALKNSGQIIPWQVVTITTNGRILENQIHN